MQALLPNANLYCILRARFPADLDSLAVSTATGLHYTWRDLERGSAMLANLLLALGLPPGARLAVQAEPSVELDMLYLASLRAGFIFLPIDFAYQDGEMAGFIQQTQPAVLVCSRKRFSRLSKIAFIAGVRNVFTLDGDRSGSLLERACYYPDQQMPAMRDRSDVAVLLNIGISTTPGGEDARLSHGCLADNAQLLQHALPWLIKG